MSSDLLTVPNLITVSRVPMALVAALCFYLDRFEPAAVMLCIAASSLDAFDGWYARAHSQCTRLGEFMDPLADKLLVTVMYAEISFQTGSYLVWAMFLLIVLREVGITLSRSYSIWKRGTSYPSDRIGKTKMFVQSAAGCGILGVAHLTRSDISYFSSTVVVVLIAVTALTYVSAYRYLVIEHFERLHVSRTEK